MTVNVIHWRPTIYPAAEDPAGLNLTLHGLWGVAVTKKGPSAFGDDVDGPGARCTWSSHGPPDNRPCGASDFAGPARGRLSGVLLISSG